MTIDIVVPTHNRAALLPRLLASLKAAQTPDGFEFRVIIVDNNSTDDTRDVVERARAEWNRPIEYRFEPVLSRSAALNTGLAAVNAELVGILDDDEEIDTTWFLVVDRMFRDPEVDFISGPYLPRWGAPPPRWLPPKYRGAIGWMEPGDRRLRYGRDFWGVMCGGNTVVRAAVGRSVGWYHPELGRIGFKPGTGCEDVDFFQRLMAIDACGYYLPELIIYHYIPPARLTKRFHREWVFNRSVAQAKADSMHPQPAAHVLGVPRYLLGTAARAIPFLLASAVSGRANTPEAFTSELSLWELAGYVRGTISRRRGLRPPQPSAPAAAATGQ